MTSLSSFWNNFSLYLNENQKKLPILSSVLKQLKPVQLTDEVIVLGCNNQGQRFFLEKKTREIEDVFWAYTNKHLKVRFEIIASEKKREKIAPLLRFEPSIEDVFVRSGLHLKYRFDNFAVSSSNQVAFAAAQAVSDSLGSAYNPLFLHGGVGVGKTHLAQAVARKILEENREKHVFFCPGDQFTNELIESIREKSTARFRKKYRKLHLLIVDDVQFIAGKRTVQEEFFHTFNSVVSAGGQIILTSDRPPEEIRDLEDRLRSRFSGGLIVDIQEPDFELRSAILLIKAREKKIEIDMDAARIIAEQVSDTRALEGTLLSVYAKTLGVKEKIDLEVVDSFFSSHQEKKVQKIRPTDAIKAVCSYYNIKQSVIKGPSRTERIALYRQLAMYILRQKLGLNLEEAALYLKRKDHTTVIHATDKITRLIAKDPAFKEEVDGVLRSIGLST